MFRQVFPNRWFVWTLSIIFIVFIYLEGTIVHLSIEQENEGLLMSATEIPRKSNVVSSFDTSGWKTYRNIKYGFELNVPLDWSEDKNINDSLTLFNNFNNRYEKGGFIPSRGMHLLIDLLPVGNYGGHVFFESNILKTEDIEVGSINFKRTYAELAKCHQQILYSKILESGTISLLFEYNPCDAKKIDYSTMANDIILKLKFFDPDDMKKPELN